MGVRLPRLCVSRVRVMPAIHTLAFVPQNIFWVCASALRFFHCMGWRLLVIYLFIYFFGFPSFIFFIFRPCLDSRGWLSVSKASRSITWSAQLLLQLLILQLMLMSQRHARRRRVFFFSPFFSLSARARVCVRAAAGRAFQDAISRYTGINQGRFGGSVFQHRAAWTAPN